MTNMWDFPGGLACNARDPEFRIPGGQEDPLEKEWQPLRVSCLGNPMGKEACRATVHGVTKELDTTKQLHK